MSLPGVSRLICVASKEFPRYSEADVVALCDGRLLLALGRKEGSSDFAKGTITGIFSRDRGLTWDDEPHMIQSAFEDVGDLMSVSFCRSGRGLHLFFLGRGPDAKRDTRVYQMLSRDEGVSWEKPVRVSLRAGYHVVNNARVIRTSQNRLVVPSAYLDGPWETMHDRMRVYCMLSDDDGVTWTHSNDLSISDATKGRPLMEPGVAECSDGSLYMTLRTKEGMLYESRSRDGGTTWVEPVATKLPSLEAPSTVTRDPDSGDLWMIWINRAKGGWKDRTPLSLAVSRDSGASWNLLGDIENDPKHSYGYVSAGVVDRQVLLTYYDWAGRGQPGFAGTNLRSRLIPAEHFVSKPTPPVFVARAEPVISADGEIVSANSGLLIDSDRWRLWHTRGTVESGRDRLRVHCAESVDHGVTWKSLGAAALVGIGESSSTYHPSVHRVGNVIVMHVWRADARDDAGLYRYISRDDGKTFTPDPERPLMVSNWTKADRAKLAGDGRVSNDAFDLLRNEDGTWEYFAACLEKATDPRTVIKHDNAAGWLRFIGRATSTDGIAFSAPEIVIRAHYDSGDAFDTQFYGLQVFRYQGFYLGLLHVYHADSQIIQPEWAWSHDGQNWVRSGVSCIALGDEGNFDSRMIVFGSVAVTADQIIWLYSGSDWRHNAYKAGRSRSCIGRATVARSELDAWLKSLPQP